MDAAELTRRKQELITREGGWIACNIDLGHGISTMEPGAVGAVELRVRRVLQLVTDYARRPLPELHILDLASAEGEFAIELARHGATVVGVEGRHSHVARARFAVEALDLEDRLTIVEDDVRRASADHLGSFDVVLCLGILYHLDVEAVLPFLRAVGDMCKDMAIIETQVGLSASRRVEDGGDVYFGTMYPEDVRYPHASIGNRQSLWLTKPSLLNALHNVGFTSVAEVLSPVILDIACYVDHVVFVARKGERASLLGAPWTPSAPEESWPERLRRRAHPAQGWRWSLMDRLDRLHGGGIHKRIFTKRNNPPPGD